MFDLLAVIKETLDSNAYIDEYTDLLVYEGLDGFGMYGVQMLDDDDAESMMEALDVQ